MAPVFFDSLASEEEHDDDDDNEDDNEEEEDVDRGMDSELCSNWEPVEDVGGRGTSGRGGPSMSPVDYYINKRKYIILTSVDILR